MLKCLITNQFLTTDTLAQSARACYCANCQIAREQYGIYKSDRIKLPEDMLIKGDYHVVLPTNSQLDSIRDLRMLDSIRKCDRNYD